MFVIRKLALFAALFLLVTPLASVDARTSKSKTKPAAAAASAPKSFGGPRTPFDLPGTSKDVNSWIDTLDQSHQVAGLAIAVVKDNQILVQRGIGYADASRGLPVTTDTVFRLASLSKAFASALAALLVEDQVLTWDTRVADIVPAFELKDASASSKLTVREILSQRVGLPHNTYDNLLEADEPYPALLEKLKDVSLTCPVGECYGYQNITYALIGDVVSALTGDFFNHQVEKRIFHPLGMVTASYGKESLEASSSWARPHVRRAAGWTPFENRDGYYRVAPAAGVNASIKDMTQWLMAQMGERPDVLSPAVLDTLHHPEITTPREGRNIPWHRARVKDPQYALGWRVFDYEGETLVYHAGYVKGYHTMIAFFPKYRFGTVLLWNCESAMPAGLMPMIMDRFLGLPGVDWAGIDTPAAAPKRARLVATGTTHAK
jgi:beta-lactamase class C